MKYVITEKGKKLSAIYTNDLPKGWFAFRKNDWMTFPTKKEAEAHLAYAYNVAKLDFEGSEKVALTNRILKFKITEEA
tara:strand:- start:35 stop:268 length:234 start_codon:yes stop_codon:yes gene_type:complete